MRERFKAGALELARGVDYGSHDRSISHSPADARPFTALGVGRL
jgi:hypothetical protein